MVQIYFALTFCSRASLRTVAERVCSIQWLVAGDGFFWRLFSLDRIHIFRIFERLRKLFKNLANDLVLRCNPPFPPTLTEGKK
jgi:hypothetical protein